MVHHKKHTRSRNRITPFLISNAHFVGVNELKGNVAKRISNAQRCKRTIKRRYNIAKRSEIPAVHLFNSHATNGENNGTSSKMNCAPTVKGKTAGPDTCYTPDTLAKIKDSYNKSHPNNQILATNPQQIAQELREKLKTCKKEDCWLEQIKDAKLRKQIDELIFAPDKPAEWIKNPNEWLSNFDIESVLKQYEKSHSNFKLLGSSPINYDTKIKEEGGRCVWEDLCKLSLKDLLEKGKTKLGVSLNLDKYDDPGSHWISMFIDLDNAVIFYYDSAMHPIPKEVNRLRDEVIRQGLALDKPIHFKYLKNKYDHQLSDGECGMFSLFFIITFLTGETDFQKNMTMDDKIALFMRKSIPDKYVRKYRTLYFN